MIVEISELLNDVSEREPCSILFRVEIPGTGLQMKIDDQVENELE
jgi:hypothetical protein